MNKPLKVAMFSRFPYDIDHPRGGVETVTVTLSQYLAKRDDIELHIITFEKDIKKETIEQRDNYVIHRLVRSRWPLFMDIMCGPGRRKLRKYIEKLKPDIVHSHEYHGLGLGPLSMPRVFTLHGLDHKNIPAEKSRLQWLRVPIWRVIEKIGLRQQQYIISITPYVRKYIEPFTNAKIFDIDNPIFNHFYEIEREERPGRIFFSGWISTRKNPLSVIQAFSLVEKSGLKASLHIAGEENDLDYAQEVHREIQRLGLAKKVKMLGRISQTDIRKQLSEASVFVLPSFQENAPMSISEAMAVGIPVITSDRCGMPYMVEHGMSGYLTQPSDVHQIAQYMIKMLSDDDLRERMGIRSRQIAQERFHPESVTEKTVNVYREIFREKTNK